MKGWGWRDSTLLVLVVLVLVPALLALYPGWPAIAEVLRDRDAPAWVQAVGSVVAIVAAIGIVVWQHELERKRIIEAEARDLDDTIRAATEVLFVMADAARQIHSWTLNPDPKHPELFELRHEVRVLLEVVTETDLLKVPHREAIRCLIAGRTLLVQLLETLDHGCKFINPRDTAKFCREDARKFRDLIEANAERAGRSLRAPGSGADVGMRADAADA